MRSVLPVATVLLALLALWYAGAVLLNAPWERDQAARAGQTIGWAEIIPIVVGAGGQGYLLKFGRDQESEADRQGLKYMVKAGYDPTGMEDVMRVLISASEGNEQWEMLSTHPDPKRRLADIERLIRMNLDAMTQHPFPSALGVPPRTDLTPKRHHAKPAPMGARASGGRPPQQRRGAPPARRAQTRAN